MNKNADIKGICNNFFVLKNDGGPIHLNICDFFEKFI